MPSFRDGYTFFSVFAIYFPAATGIMAGANISGDLAEPQVFFYNFFKLKLFFKKSIPLGTLLSIGLTTIIYMIVVIITGSTCVRYADGVNFPELISSFNPISNVNEPYKNDWIFISYKSPPCSVNNSCPYGLMNYFQVIIK